MLVKKIFATDKLKHLVLGLLIYSALTHLVSPLISLLITVFIAIAKEVIWDKLLKKGTPEILDVVMTIVFPFFLFLIQTYLLPL
jgi:hypothetical protein